MSIELLTLAVLWTHFCVDRTADLGSSMDTFLMLRMLRKLPDLSSFMDTYSTGYTQTTKTADPPSFRDFGLLCWKSVHKTAKVSSFCGFGLLHWKSDHKTA